MSYYKILGLEEEPFSTSPDPSFFYESREHREALLRLEIAIKLRRGLSLILGDVGNGKTTLARKLFARLGDDSRYLFGMVLDPGAESELDFILSLTDVYDIHPAERSVAACKKALERFLHQKGLEEGKTVVLLVDEAQKLSQGAIEVLRTLLNYETNKFKLLQLVLLSQMELLPRVREIRNFWERIALKYVINPLNLEETHKMIQYRLRRGGYKQEGPLFTAEAVEEIHSYTQGCPRRITMLCHDALEILVIRNKTAVDREITQELIAEDSRIGYGQFERI
ncbi:MAG: AAA family ATPase [Candidatus Omnitrophica bacterium]|nr:AAA family ATPase [Candidatus Omnitrophota bacterium]